MDEDGINDEDLDNNVANPEAANAMIMNWFAHMFQWFVAKFNITQTAAQFILSLIYAMLILSSHPLKNCFPSTRHQVESLHGLKKVLNCSKMMVCPANRCNAVYVEEDTYTNTADSGKDAKQCSANHYGKVCGEPLHHQKKFERHFQYM